MRRCPCLSWRTPPPPRDSSQSPIVGEGRSCRNRGQVLQAAEAGVWVTRAPWRERGAWVGLLSRPLHAAHRRRVPTLHCLS